jgi:hypothetical protein
MTTDSNTNAAREKSVPRPVLARAISVVADVAIICANANLPNATDALRNVVAELRPYVPEMELRKAAKAVKARYTKGSL